MAIETLYADGDPVSTGNCLNPSNAHGAPDAAWAGPTTTNSDWTHRWSIGNPVNPLTSNTQTITVVARKNGTGGTNPTLTVNLYENGSLIGQIAQATVTSTTGQNVTGTFAGTVITNRNDVEIELVSSHGGGGPTGRYEVQVTSITWTADTAVVAPSYPASASWGFAETETFNKVGQSSILTNVAAFSEFATTETIRDSAASIAFGFSESATGEVASSEVNADISFSFGFSETAENGTDRETDVAYSFGFSELITQKKSGEADLTLSFGHAESSTFYKSGEADLTYSWGHSETIEASVAGTPAAVTDLVATTGASGEVVLTWSAPV